MAVTSWSRWLRSRLVPARLGKKAGRQRSAPRLAVEPLEPRLALSAPGPVPPFGETEPNDQEADANPIAPTAVVNARLDAPDDVDFFALDVTEPGALTVRVEPGPGSSLDSRAALYTTTSYLLFQGAHVGGGGLLVVSDDRGPGDPNPLIQQFVRPGPYLIAVSAAGVGDVTGAYTLSTSFRATRDPADDPATLLRPGVP